MPLARVTSEVWKRVVLWVVILILSSVIVIGWNDYWYMDTQMRLMKAEFIDDVVGYSYCDGGE
jgi:hypothetical protein